MFRFFKKKNLPDDLVRNLRVHFSQVTALVTEIDGPYVNLFEGGIFVSTIATTKILTLDGIDPQRVANEFNEKWVEYLCSSYSVNGEPPSKELINGRIQKLYPIYRELFLKVINPDNRKKMQDSSVQLMWELFSNCTVKKKPDSDANFITLISSSGKLVDIGLDILKKV